MLDKANKEQLRVKQIRNEMENLLNKREKTLHNVYSNSKIWYQVCCNIHLFLCQRKQMIVIYPNKNQTLIR